MSESTVSKQDRVVELVKAGLNTRKEIRELVGCTTGALASYLSGMRNAAKYTGQALCPVESVINEGTDDEKKVMTVVTFQEAEDAKAARATKASGPAKTPQERLEAAEKRVEKCGKAVDAAKERHEKDDENRELELRFKKAEIDAELADIELARAKAVVAEDESAEEAADAADALETEDELV